MMPSYGRPPRKRKSDCFSRISIWIKKHPNILRRIMAGTMVSVSTFGAFKVYQAFTDGGEEIQQEDASSQQGRITLIPNHCESRVGAAEKFNAVAKQSSWIEPGKGQTSKSGFESNLEEAYFTVKHIDKFIQEQGIKSFADIPCGDMNWQGASKKLNTIDVYLGADISKSILADNEMTFEQHHNKVFRDWDLVQCPVPQYQLSHQVQPQSFEMVMTRHVIQHLPLSDGLKFVQNVVLSPGIKFWAVSSWRTENRNVGAKGGHSAFHPNNLDIAPFNLPKENIVFSQRSHPIESLEPDFFVVYMIDENIKNVVKSYDV